MTRSLVIATGNAGKLKEIQHILAPWQWQVHSQKEFKVSDADETGLSFVENAIIKARPLESAAHLVKVKGVGEKTLSEIVKSRK